MGVNVKNLPDSVRKALEKQGHLPDDEQKQKSKFGNERVHDPDHGWFDSKHEHQTFLGLVLEQRAGRIRDLRRQVRFKFGDPVSGKWVLGESGRPLVYVADYTFEEKTREGDWRYIVADAKGAKTKEYLIKKGLMAYFYGIQIREM